MDRGLRILKDWVTDQLTTVPQLRFGTLLSVGADGRLTVLLDGEHVLVAGDRRFPNPPPGPVVLMASRGSFLAVAFPAAST